MNALPIIDGRQRSHRIAPPTSRTVRYFFGRLLRVLLGLTPLLFPVAAAAEEAGPLEVGVVGGADVLWAYRRDASATTESDLLRFCYQLTTGASAQRYWPGPIVIGHVAAAAVSGTGLHLFFRDGTHRHYLPDPRIMRTGPPFTDIGEPNLPLGVPPLAVCWDQKTSCLVAVISAAQSAALPLPWNDQAERGEDQPETSDADEAEKNPDTPAPASAASPPQTITTPFALARYASRQWTLDRATPPELDAEGMIVGMLASEGTIHLVYADEVDSHTFLHRMLPATGNTWSTATTFTLAEQAEPLAVGWQDNRPVVLFREAAPNGVTIGTISLVDHAWKIGPLLAKNAAEAERFEGVTGACFAGSSVAVAMSDPHGDVRIGAWSAASGGVERAPTIAPPLAPSLFPKVDPGARHALQYAMLLAVLAAVFIWRRDRVMAVFPVGERDGYARFQHRFLAFTLDLVILAPVWGLILYQLVDRSDQGISFTEQLLQNPSTLPAGWFWSWAIIGGVFAPYATVFEHWLGATPGKRIIGCRVVGEHGKRCSLLSIVIRNAVRPIEFHFTAIVLLVFLTPSRQRLGDILAGVVVVETVRPEHAIGDDVSDDDNSHTDLIA